MQFSVKKYGFLLTTCLLSLSAGGLMAQEDEFAPGGEASLEAYWLEQNREDAECPEPECPAIECEEPEIPEPIAYMEMNVSCGEFGLSNEDFSTFTLQQTGGGAEQKSTLKLAAELPRDVVVELEYDITLDWQTNLSKRAKTVPGDALFIGGKGQPPSIEITHKDFYKPIKITVTALRCHAARAELPEVSAEEASE